MPRLKDVRNSLLIAHSNSLLSDEEFCCCCWMKIRQKMLSSTKKSTKDMTSMTFIIDIELIKLSTTPVFPKQK